MRGWAHPRPNSSPDLNPSPSPNLNPNLALALALALTLTPTPTPTPTPTLTPTLAQALIAQAPALVPKTCFSDSVSEEDMYEPPRVVLRGFWDSGEEVSWLALATSP